MPRAWWRHWPPLPWPDAAYVGFRLVAYYGDAGHALEPDDLVRWLRWCQRMRAIGG